MSEVRRIERLVKEQGPVGAILEHSHYRAIKCTRTILYALGVYRNMRVQTSLEVLEEHRDPDGYRRGRYLMWYKFDHWPDHV